MSIDLTKRTNSVSMWLLKKLGQSRRKLKKWQKKN